MLSKSIPLEHKILLILREQSGLSLTDISKMVGTCRQTVSKRVNHLIEYGLIDVEKGKGLLLNMPFT
jgi:Mn-dependent DtxR family transcriptional regulator